jgi:DeoR/GlpR family transcriptional regulator of sugar metabolism
VSKFTRKRRILELVAETGEVSVSALAAEFRASRMTIRRDLEELVRTGQLSRTHGGAGPLAAGVIKFSFQTREHLHVPEKRAIARAVARMIRPGMAVSLDTGTTTLAVARMIAATPGLTVLTSSLAIASALYASRDLDLVLLGGSARRTSPDLVGSITEENLRRFRVHLAVLGADAVSRDGTYAADESVCRICRAMALGADRVVVAADSSKFGQTAFALCLALKDIDQLVTDDGCPAEAREWLRGAVRQVTYAEVLRPLRRQEAAHVP